MLLEIKKKSADAVEILELYDIFIRKTIKQLIYYQTTSKIRLQLCVRYVLY